ncbi:PucR C-terminal helix-turn-helix domain-containing protein [Lentibacillus persicus]|uniref:PucR C-terminal helix-turn-helix domain-containing protein n=1 Tax=Lentibacillus persicus TaxID=640948 RepID=A0A1I1RQR9_9BACI|nr:helix-turn-helix domain-containing protein [Lentibacillus persicus]SFD36482.1 PucR C-terminal helix-turn-helix domain-containing protein [Lentibacillus persicus]
MIEQLRNIFSSLILSEDAAEKENDNYQWFTTENGTLIGIHNSELDTKDIQLLNTFLWPHSNSLPDLAPEEKNWLTYIRADRIPEPSSQVFRFIHFSFRPNQIEPSLFKEAVNAFFAKEVPVLWENDHEGIIVETEPDEPISYDTIIDILMSDLAVKVRFFVGPFMTSLKNAKEGYKWLMEAAVIARKYSGKPVTTYVDAFPFMLINQTTNAFRNGLARTVLAEAIDATELLITAETFIACNLNVSLTAKELYLHRNSLQYRLDKFKEKTNIDIRDFHQAATVYLAILATK